MPITRPRQTPAFWLATLAATASLLVPATACAADVSLNDEGVGIAITGMGGFTISYPALQPGDLKPVQKKVKGKQADLTYAGDIGLHVELGEGGKVDLRFSNVKAMKSFTLQTMIGSHFGDGGTWTIGKGQPTAFPAEKPAKPHLYQGNATGFTLTDASNHVLSITGFPDFAYQELTDNREWGWKIFAWKLHYPYNPQWDVHSLVVSEKPHGAVVVAPAGAPKFQVDRFGQTTRKEFPGKVKAEADLAADVAGEAAYWASYKPAAVDRFGGLPGSAEKLGVKGNGFFRVEKKDGRWLLVNPDGNLTFHLGICVFGYAPGDEMTYVNERRDIYEWLPPVEGEYGSAWHPEGWWRSQAFSFYAANVVRKYGKDSDKDAQLGRLVDRVRAVGFNHVGAFSGYSKAFTDKAIPRMAHIGFGPELPGVRGVGDPFDEEAKKRTAESWAKSLPKSADDPFIIGYFFANEQGFEDIPRAVPQLNGKHAAKRKLVEMLQAKYKDIAAFNTAWNVQVAGFDALADKGLPVSTKAAFADMQAYTELFLDTYFRFLTETFRAHDKNHLMVSNRWQPGTANNEALCRAAGKYMDVISINYYAMGIDKSFVTRLYDWTGGKPQMWSEFYYTSGAESNAAPTSMDMATQKARGEAYRQYVEQGAATGFVVGIEWFTLIDQAVTGRWFSKLGGERANTGLFNACDRPYDACLREMAKAHAAVYDVWLGKSKPFVIDDPRFTGGAGKTRKLLQAGKIAAGDVMKVDGLADGWPGRPPELIGSDRIVGGKDGKGLEAAFKVSWDASNLYLLVNITDPTPLNNGRHGEGLWDGDGVELFIGSEKLDQPGTLLYSDRQVLLGGVAEVKPDSRHVVNAAKQPDITLVNVPSVDGSGYTMEVAIPWSALDITPKENLELIFDLAVDDAPQGGGRTRQLMWNGGARNSGDRSYWGRLQLVP